MDAVIIFSWLEVDKEERKGFLRLPWEKYKKEGETKVELEVCVLFRG